MAKSSGHFKKAKANSEAHNSRKEVPNYLLPSEYRTPNGRGSEFIKYHDPKELFEQELAKKNATKTRGKRPKFENSVWEIEVNCNEVHTLEDGQKLAKDLEHLLSYTCCSVALHRDEGQSGPVPGQARPPQPLMPQSGWNRRNHKQPSRALRCPDQ